MGPSDMIAESNGRDECRMNYIIFCTRSDVRGNELRKVRNGGEKSRWDELFLLRQM